MQVLAEIVGALANAHPRRGGVVRVLEAVAVGAWRGAQIRASVEHPPRVSVVVTCRPHTDSTYTSPTLHQQLTTALSYTMVRPQGPATDARHRCRAPRAPYIHASRERVRESRALELLPPG
eukprot:scaffold78990_cov61-Phaeocystis_antarctica.AAC.1